LKDSFPPRCAIPNEELRKWKRDRKALLAQEAEVAA
jgi:hypothetical protein